MTTQLDHDNRAETSYPIGRQPFSYRRIIEWAKANGYAYEFFSKPPTRLYGGIRLGLRVKTRNGWEYFRGVEAARK